MIGIRHLLLAGLACAAPADAAAPEPAVKVVTGPADDDGRPHPHHQPRPWPDRIALTPGADPAHAMAVSWRTDASVTEARLELAVALDGPGSGARATLHRGRTIPLASANGAAHYHQVRLEGLKAGTFHGYRVAGADGEWSPWLQFRTATVEAAPFNMLYFGDIQNDIASEGSRAIRAAYAATPDVALALHAGDLVAQGKVKRHDDEWGEWTRASGAMLAMVPQLPVAGNHEYRDAIDGDGKVTHQLGPHWGAQFALPANGSADAATATSYFVDHQGVRIVAFDGTAALEHGALASQAAWLDRVLAERGDRFAIVAMHQPLFTCARPNDTAPFVKVLAPILAARGVDLVLQGHDHCHRRSGAADWAEGKGPVYIVSVSGPKMYGLNPRVAAEAERYSADTQLYHRIAIDRAAGRIRVEALTPTGRRYDGFTMIRNADGTRTLTEDPKPPVRTCAADKGPDGLPCAGRDVSTAR